MKLVKLALVLILFVIAQGLDLSKEEEQLIEKVRETLSSNFL
jgi:hypothetical protein